MPMTSPQISARAFLSAVLSATLFAETAIWLMLEPFAFFGGMDGGGLNGAILAATPLLLACLLAGLALILGEFPRLTPVAVIAGLLSAALLAWTWHGYQRTRPRTEAPPLVQGYDLRAHVQGTEFEDPVQSARWTALLQKRFPIGSSVAELQETLDEQRFSVHGRVYKGPEAGPYREYNWIVGPCYYGLMVRWNANSNDRITKIEGRSTLTHDNKARCP